MLSYSDECRTKKAFKYVKRMLPLFRPIVKFCSTSRLFTNFTIINSLGIVTAHKKGSIKIMSEEDGRYGMAVGNQ